MKEKNEFPIAIVMTTYSIIWCMYIFTYSNGLKLFWAFFVIERLLGMSYEREIDRYFFKLDQALDSDNIKGGGMLSVVIFTLLGVGIYLYTPFKYPGLFGILIGGEVIDFIIKRIKKKIRSK